MRLAFSQCSCKIVSFSIDPALFLSREKGLLSSKRNRYRVMASKARAGVFWLFSFDVDDTLRHDFKSRVPLAYSSTLQVYVLRLAKMLPAPAPTIILPSWGSVYEYTQLPKLILPIKTSSSEGSSIVATP